MGQAGHPSTQPSDSDRLRPSPAHTSLSSVSFESRYTRGSRFLVFLDFSSSYFFRKSSGVRENSAILTSKAYLE